MRRRTPQDLERIDARLVRFWERYGEAIDYSLIVLCIAACAWTFGYLVGQASR
jgi:hypothetical protein